MFNKDKILQALINAQLCDDCLSIKSNVKPRQTVYSNCEQLSENSLIKRFNGICDHCHKTKKTNLLLENTNKIFDEAKVEINNSTTSDKPWYWEGNIQNYLINYLVQNGYMIHSVANTATKVAGKDIIASLKGNEIWISVKGYPEKSQHVQARHWFSSAIFDLILYHGENPKVKLGIAIPESFTTYNNLVPRIKWLKESMNFVIYWVDKNGNVRID